MKIFKLFFVTAVTIISLSCGDDITYPTTFTFDDIDIELSRTVVGETDGSTREVEPESLQFAQPLQLLEGFGAPAQLVSITLLSESELKLTNTDGQEVLLDYSQTGVSLINNPFSLLISDDNYLFAYGCMTVIFSSTNGYSVNVDFCTFSDQLTNMDALFTQNQLMEGDTLGFTTFKANYR